MSFNIIATVSFVSVTVNLFELRGICSNYKDSNYRKSTVARKINFADNFSEISFELKKYIFTGFIDLYNRLIQRNHPAACLIMVYKIFAWNPLFLFYWNLVF